MRIERNQHTEVEGIVGVGIVAIHTGVEDLELTEHMRYLRLGWVNEKVGKS